MTMPIKFLGGAAALAVGGLMFLGGGTATQQQKADIIGYEPYAYCADTKTDARSNIPITDQEYSDYFDLRMEIIRPGVVCTSASRTPIYNTPSGKLEKGFYVQEGAKYQTPIFFEYQDATGTHEVIAGFDESTSPPTAPTEVITP